MKPLHIVQLDPIFAHERTELYQRTRELHAFAAQLEATAGSSRYFGALTHMGLLAMMSTASAGVAPTDRSRARHLASLRDRLARFASTLRSMADRDLLDGDTVRFGSHLVSTADALVKDFDLELRCVEASLLSTRQDAVREMVGVGVANDERPSSSPAVKASGQDKAEPRTIDFQDERHDPSRGGRAPRETSPSSQSGARAQSRASNSPPATAAVAAPPRRSKRQDRGAANRTANGR